MKIALETKHFILKFLDLYDLENLVALRSDADVMKYIGDGSIHTEEKVKNFLLNDAIPYQEKHGTGFFAVFEKESGNFIGQAGLFHLGFYDKQPDIELAYRLHKQYWGKGYATELAIALIKWGFEHLDISKIVSGAEIDNIASQKVLIKAGFDFKGKQKWWNGREMFYYEIYKNDSIQLVPYDTQWPILAEKEIKNLHTILPKQHIIDIQHVGSTAIPGMIAKPIIDIQIVVDSLPAVKQKAIDIVTTQEYVYWDENPDQDRMFFVKGMPPFGDKRTHHIHIIEPKALQNRNKILFRDYLIKHLDAANEYKKLKRKLAEEYTYHREQYTDAKNKFIGDILLKAQNELSQHTQYQIVIDYDPSQADNAVVREGLISFNESITGEPRDREFSIFLKNDSGKIFGGLKAFFDTESVYIETFWVDEKLRYQGWGRKLLYAAEQEAIKNGCIFSLLDTWSFQAEEFYLKNGYEQIGEIKNYWHHHSKIFLRKCLKELK